MLLTNEVILEWNSHNKKYYESKGYIFTEYKKEFKVKIEDLSVGAKVFVDCKCDGENCENPILNNIQWTNYLKCVKEDGKYYCQKCARNLYGGKNIKLARLRNGKSFEQWCIENNRQDVLDRWDYKLNDCKPSEINFSSKNKYYLQCPKKLHSSELKQISNFTHGSNGSVFCNQCNSFEQWCINNNRQDILDRWDYELNNCKPNEVDCCTGKKRYFKCPKGIHKSELKHIDSFVHGEEGVMNCKACNSFAQWGIDNLGEDFLEKYWDYEKNVVDPWAIGYGSGKSIYIKCQEKDYHGSYKTTCSTFSIQGNRCALCLNKNGKVHILDSLGTLYPQVLNIWSNKNNKSPYEYPPKSKQEVFWKCPEGIHEDYPRNILNSNKYDFRCPNCQFSQGEKRIENYLLNNNIEYISQKEFEGLVGLKNGNLSYDFYLPDFNLLIEYQGEFHDGDKHGKRKAKYLLDILGKQQEHDRRKKEYTLKHNINLLEIWYWDFDNIEEILKKELRLA